MDKVDELKDGLASVGIGWIEPQDRRNKAGRFMLARGVKMGVAVDPGDVQSMLCEFCDIYVRDLEARVEAYRRIAEDAVNMRPTPPFILPAHLRDDAPHKTCNLCGRKSWSREEWLTMCNMPQPNGERCRGTIR